MATSQYSILRQYTPYVSPYNLDLIKDVMVYKQGQVDANRAKINQQVDYLMGQQIAKPEAREYMENRMADTLARVNEMYRGADLSSEGITRHIQSEISSVLDSTVINAIAGTKEGQHMQDQLNEMATNGDKAYSDMNAYVAMKPYYEWLNDGKAGSRLQPLHYTPYTDYNAEVQSAMKTIQQAALKGHKYSFPLYGDDNQPTGAMIEYTNSSITPQQAAAYAAASISPNARQQMQIEAIYMADMQPEQFSYNSYQNYLGGQIEEMNSYIGMLNAEMMGVGGNEHRRQELQSEINRAKGVLVQLKDAADVPMSQYSPYQAAAMVVNRNFLNSAAQRYSFDNSSTEIKEDPVFWNNKKLQIQQANYNLNVTKAESLNKYREAQLNLRREELEIRRTEAENRANRQAGATGADGGTRSTSSTRIPTSSTVTNPTFNPREVDAAKENADRYSGMVQQRSAEVTKFMNTLRPEDRQNILDYISEKQKNANSGYAGLSMEDALMKYFEDNNGLNNSVFSTYSEGVDADAEAERRTNLINSYNAISKLTQNINADNARISALNNLQQRAVSQAFPVLSREYRDRGLENPDASALRALVGEAIYRQGSKTGVFENGTLTTDFITMINRDINAIQAQYDTAAGRSRREVNLWDYFRWNNETNSYDFITGAGTPEAVNAIRDYMITGNLQGQTSLASRAVSRIADMDTSEAQREIENRYYQQRLRSERIFSTKMNNSDPEYATMNALRDLHTRYRDQNPMRSQSQFANVDSYLLRELPDGNFQIVAMYNGVNTSAAMVSRADLIANGVNVGQSSFQIPTGGYNSGQKKVQFADPNNVDYIQIVENNMGPGGDIYATKSGVEGLLSDNITSGFNSRATKFDSDTRSVLMNQMGRMIASILDNAENFRVQFVGFDERTSQSSGYDTIVSLINPRNPEGRPKQIIKDRTNGIEYMDGLDTTINQMPQVVFTEILQQGISNEVDYLAKKGYTMDDITRLTNERRPIFDPTGILMRLYAAINEGGNGDAQQ